MRPKGSGAELERRRRRAVELLERGHAPVDVARMVGVDRRSVRRWRATYRRQGAPGLTALPVPGRPPKLKARQRQQLLRALMRGAKRAGFESDLWTCPRVAAFIAGRFGVEYHVDHVGRLLRSLGLTPQRPQRLALERDEEEIQRWIREDWPHIKKKPVAAKPRSRSSTRAAS